MVVETPNIRYTEWKLFLDGVEIPHQGFSITFSAGEPTTMTTVLEPDTVLRNIRPQSVISVFFRDEHPETEEDYAEGSEEELGHRFQLYWEGLTTGYDLQKAGSSRQFQLRAEDMMAPLRRAYAFAIGLGSYAVSPLISGSTKVDPSSLTSSFFDILTYKTIGDRLFSAVPGPPLDRTVAYRYDPENTPFSDRIIRLINFLGSGNAVTRQQLVRYRILNRLFGINDKALENIIAPTLGGIVAHMDNSMSGGTTVMGVVTHIMSYGFYRVTQIPAPTRPPEQPTDNMVHPSLEINAPSEDADEVVKVAAEKRSRLLDIKAEYFRNEFFISPNLYFTAPPPCNFVFPSQIQSITASRNVYQEPTRVIVPSPVQNFQDSLYVSPPSLFRRGVGNDDPKTTSGIFGIIEQNIEGTDFSADAEASPYLNVDGEGKFRINTLKAVLASELEKGVIANIGNYGFESMAAIAKNIESNQAEGSQFDTTLRINSFDNFMTDVSDYTHQIRKYRREVTASIVGNRYIVPGFTAAIFDGDISYTGLVSRVSISVDPEGSEIIQVYLTQARPITPVDFSDLAPRFDVIREYVLTSEFQSLLYDSQDIKEIKEAERQIATRLEEIEDLIDAPIPPAFFSDDFNSTKFLDASFKNLLGCKKFYTSEYVKNKRAGDSSTFEGFTQLRKLQTQTRVSLSGHPIQRRVNDRIGAMLFYLQVASALNAVYRMFDASDPLPDGTGGSKPVSWQEMQSTSSGEQLDNWMYSKFLKRDTTSLYEYIQDNNLKLERSVSDAPRKPRVLGYASDRIYQSR